MKNIRDEDVVVSARILAIIGVSLLLIGNVVLLRIEKRRAAQA